MAFVALCRQRRRAPTAAGGGAGAERAARMQGSSWGVEMLEIIPVSASKFLQMAAISAAVQTPAARLFSPFKILALVKNVYVLKSSLIKSSLN